MGDDQKPLNKWELETSILWKGVELDSVLDLLQDCPIKEFTEGAVLIQAGQPNDFLYLILSGRLRIHLKDLTLAPIVMLEPGEVVGEMSVFDRQPASAYVVAQEDSRLLVLDRATIWSLIEIYPIVARNLLFVLAQRLRSGNALVEEWLLERVSESALGAFPFQSPGSQATTARVEKEEAAEWTPWEVPETGLEDLQPQKVEESPAAVEEGVEAERTPWEVPETGLEDLQPQEVEESPAAVVEGVEAERTPFEVVETGSEELPTQEVEESPPFVEEKAEAERTPSEVVETGSEELPTQEVEESPPVVEEKAEAERIGEEVVEGQAEESQPQGVQESRAIVEEESEGKAFSEIILGQMQEESRPQESPESEASVGEEIEAERVRQELAKIKRYDAQSRQVLQSQVLGEEDIDAETISLYTIATAYVLESIRRVEQRRGPDIDKGKELAQRLSDSIVESSALLLLATDRRQDFAVSTHCVNVSVLSLRLSKTLDYLLPKQIEVGLAALLHEIGVAKLPERMLQDPGQMRPEARQRPVYGAQILEELCPEYGWLAKTVGQVYERENGSGFPQGLKGEDICEEAKILGIMDVFEACIHDRPHRKALTGYQLLDAFTRGKTETFAAHLVKALIEGFSVYTYNEYVVLNTDEMGRVVEVNSGNLCRPLVRILYDKERKSVTQPLEIDLSKTPSLFITKAVTYDELIALAETDPVDQSSPDDA
ncbi:MAG: cyclic nucleotide-binding domain-containing protein [Acidobacteria bacterium]|nr:cyclic nucleotide-binding domain-containing protein [Acidobacteriota bacterium]